MKKIFEGVFEAKSGGFGFVCTEEGDIFVPAKFKNGAMQGDTVAVEIDKNPKDGLHAEGKVAYIISEGETLYVGNVDKSKNAMFVICDNPAYEDIYIPKSKNKHAKNGEKVVVKIIKRAEHGNSPEGEVVEILGKTNAPGIDILGIAKSFGLEAEFDEKVKKEARKLKYSPDLQGRVDLRKQRIFTIDGDDAKDLDDAVSIKKLGNGNFELGVHIADVSHYVRENSELDKEALRRGTSVYLIDRVIPMLPKELSNDLCSLNEGEDKLTLSCIMEISGEGDVILGKIVNSVINSCHRMTYNNVNKMLDGDKKVIRRYEDIYGDIMLMSELAKILRKKRDELGSIDFEIDEPKIELNKKGFPIKIYPAVRGEAEKIIEEFMLMANMTVAEQYFYMDVPFLYRVHGQPDSDRMKELAVFLQNFGISLKGFMNIHPKAIQKVLADAQDTDEFNIINRVTLRSLKKAVYSTESEGHFGLAAERYCHFTSPIRRYPDLCDHRIIKHIIAKGMDEKYLRRLEKILPEIANNSSKRERNAIEAERMVENKKMAEYMSVRIGEKYEGIVSGVTKFGIFVELENTVEGMIPLSSLKDDYYIFNEKMYRVEGEHTHRRISLGDRIKIVVTYADIRMGKIEFGLDE